MRLAPDVQLGTRISRSGSDRSAGSNSARELDDRKRLGIARHAAHHHARPHRARGDGSLCGEEAPLTVERGGRSVVPTKKSRREAIMSLRSLTEHAATLLELILVDLAACKTLFEDIEWRLRRRCMMRRLRPVPRWPNQRPKSQTPAITTTSTKIMNRGPKIMPYQPPLRGVSGVFYRYLSGSAGVFANQGWRQDGCRACHRDGDTTDR